jgi:hypothetical protein
MSEYYYLGRKVKEQINFKEVGTFQSFYTAQGWIRKSGYVHGSMCMDMPIALKKGKTFKKYDLPEKWKNFTDEDIASVDGVIISRDFREGEVSVLLF